MQGKPKGALHYCRADSPFGPALIAWNTNGLCYLGFCKDTIDLVKRWPNAQLKHSNQNPYADLFSTPQNIQTALYGSKFDHKVWLALLKIPDKRTATYSDIATAIHQPTAQRATASAIGRNPISLLIPCHRVIRADRSLGGYHWGLKIKQEILVAENNSG